MYDILCRKTYRGVINEFHVCDMKIYSPYIFENDSLRRVLLFF